MQHAASTPAPWSALLSQACQPPPPTWQTWTLQGATHPLGLMSPQRMALVAQAMPADLPLRPSTKGWVWHASHASATERSQVLQQLAQQWHDQGLIEGWRFEAYACWGNIDQEWPYTQAECFRLERAAFRFLGLRSHASHVHGFTPDGRMWCGRRALSKATDPGLLDNLAAGGLPADEHPLGCAVREVFEEAGLVKNPSDFAPTSHVVLTERAEPQGWHSERLFVFALQLAPDEQPVNQDGEVSEFLCLSPADLIQRISAGQFTADAACAIAAWWAQPARRRHLGRKA